MAVVPGGPGGNGSYTQNALGQYNYNGLSQDPQDASGFYNTLQQAEQAWQQSQAQNQQMTGLTQPGYLPSPTLINPAQYGGSQLSLSSLDPALLAALGPQQAEALINQGFQPQSNAAESNLNNTLAASGLSGGPAVMAQDQLQASLASALAPSLAGAVQNSQNNILGAVDTNAGLQEQTGLANTAAANAANTANAGAINSTNAGNTQIYDQEQQQLLQYIMSVYNQKAGAYGNVAAGAQSGGNALGNSAISQYQIPTGTGQGLSGLFGALGSIYGGGSTPSGGGGGQTSPSGYQLA